MNHHSHWGHPGHENRCLVLFAPSTHCWVLWHDRAQHSLFQTPTPASTFYPHSAVSLDAPASRSGAASIRRLTRSRSNTPHVDDLPPPPQPPQQQQPSADIAEDSIAAAAQPSAERDAEAERAAFLAATDGFAFEGPVVVIPLHVEKLFSYSEECPDPRSGHGTATRL